MVLREADTYILSTFLSAQTGVQSQTSSYGICGGRIGTRTRF